MKRDLVILLLAQIVLGIVYVFATPIFEASDEIWHYPVVREIAVNHRLPVQDPAVDTAWAQEGSQPPLYYAISALLTGWIDTSDYTTTALPNPFAKIGIPLATDNKTMMAHPSDQNITQGGTTLAVYIIRCLSVLMGTVTVYLAYRLGQTIYPTRPTLSLLMAALTAFNPMALFINASVNNDNLVMLLSTLSLLMLIRDAKSNQPGLRWGSTILMGVTLGLAAITKVSGLVLLPIAAMSLVLSAWSTRAWKARLVRTFAVTLVTVAIAGWWYIRNMILYGEPTGLQRMAEIAGPRPLTFHITDLLSEWKGFWYSFWGVFGGFNVLAPSWFYTMTGCLSIVAGMGLILGLIRSLQKKQLPGRWHDHLLLIVFITLTFIGLIRWTMMTTASQGRLMFAAIVPISLYLALGLLAWVPVAWHVTTTRLLAATLATVAFVIPTAVIRPAYQSLPPIQSLPTDAVNLNVRCGNSIVLVGYRLGSDTTVIGQPVDVTLYWTAMDHLDANLDLSLNVYGFQFENVAKLDTWPGGGLRPTAYWETGMLYPDRYLLSTRPNSNTPTLLKLGIDWSTNLLNLSRNQSIPCYVDGQPVDSLFLDAGGLVSEQSATTLVSPAPIAFLQHDLQLLSAQITHSDDRLIVDLTWQTTEPVASNYTIFAHLFDRHGVKIAQNDAPPRQGFWPTSRWRPSEGITSTCMISIPSNASSERYVLGVGMYDASNGQRIPAYKPDGEEWRDWMIVITSDLTLP